MIVVCYVIHAAPIRRSMGESIHAFLAQRSPPSLKGLLLCEWWVLARMFGLAPNKNIVNHRLLRSIQTEVSFGVLFFRGNDLHCCSSSMRKRRNDLYVANATVRCAQDHSVQRMEVFGWYNIIIDQPPCSNLLKLVVRQGISRGASPPRFSAYHCGNILVKVIVLLVRRDPVERLDMLPAGSDMFNHVTVIFLPFVQPGPWSATTALQNNEQRVFVCKNVRCIYDDRCWESLYVSGACSRRA